MKLDILIEGLLFYRATTQNKLDLMKLLDVSSDEFDVAIEHLRERLSQTALRLVETEDEIELTTAPEISDFLSKLRKQELSADIGKAGAETLAIILYKEPVSRGEIDKIRGVNSSFILRNLLIRGLIQRESKKGSYYYKITPELLEHLGHDQKYSLPRFSEFMNALEEFDGHTS